LDDPHERHLEALFAEARELDASERERFVEAHCAEDRELRDALETLLEEEDETLIAPLISRFGQVRRDGSLEGTDIGAYHLLRRIGAGGMGSVYLAQRADGTFERQVALKVVKRGMDSESVLRRFEQERQILARLSHPNIAGLLDGGMTGDGRPYFVMEYVDGLPINRYCDEHRLGVADRLRVFQGVCRAVHHAHQSLVIHRDLKPSNILVTPKGEVKLLDFGIAKVLDEPSDRDLTSTGMQVLTPAYAAPEQVRGDSLTTAVDVYALGVVLYELLTGARPFEPRRSARELRELILNEAPRPPSTVVTEAPALSDGKPDKVTVEQRVARRSTTTQRLRQALSGDLDTICLMALRKAPETRYRSSEQLADDLQRHLDGQPVQARPDSTLYRLRKFARRNRGGLVATLAGVLGLSALVAYYTHRLAEERDAALAEQRRTAEVVDFVTGLFEVSDPAESRGADITARELLEAGAREIETELTEQPDLQATMRQVLGGVYYTLNEQERAVELLVPALETQRALPDSELDAATTELMLARVAQDQGDYEEAGEIMRRVLALRRARLEAPHPDILEAISDLAFLEETLVNLEPAQALHEEALAMARALYPGDHLVVTQMQSDLAGLHRTQDRPDLAEPLLRDGIATLDRLYGLEHPQAGKMLRQLAGLLRNTGRFEEAEPLYLQAIDIEERMLGPEHYELAVTWNSYSQLLTDMGRHEEGVAANQRFVAIVEAAYDGPHPSLGAAYNNLAWMLMDLDRQEEAEANFMKSLDMLDDIGLPADHLNRTFPTSGIAKIYRRQGRLDEAERLYRDMLAVRLEVLEEDHRLVSEMKTNLAGVLLDQQRWDEAETLLLDARERLLRDRGPEDKRSQDAIGRLIQLYEATGREAEAEALRPLFTGKVRD